MQHVLNMLYVVHAIEKYLDLISQVLNGHKKILSNYLFEVYLSVYISDWTIYYKHIIKINIKLNCVCIQYITTKANI